LRALDKRWTAELRRAADCRYTAPSSLEEKRGEQSPETLPQENFCLPAAESRSSLVLATEAFLGWQRSEHSLTLAEAFLGRPSEHSLVQAPESSSEVHVSAGPPLGAPA